MGKIIRLNGVTLTDSSAPKILERDGIESAGSLFLFDGAHESATFSGVPDANATIPNVLANKAGELIGSGDASSLAFIVNGKSVDSANFKTERTGKGGIHGIVTQSGSQTGLNAFTIKAPVLVRDYIYANRVEHQFYFSLWSRTTRLGIAASNYAPQAPFFLAPNTTNLFFHFQAGVSGAGPIGAQRIGWKNMPLTNDYVADVPAPFDRFASAGVHGVTGTGQVATDHLLFGVGNFGAWESFNRNKCASRIIYRAYAEDLTASGRTYAEVEAIDYALFQTAFAPGGKFYGDTYTDPATLP